jgi:hypothetical protein
MSWKKGLVRLWVAVSLLWLIFPAYVLLNQFRAVSAYNEVIEYNERVAQKLEPSDIPLPIPPEPPNRTEAVQQFVVTGFGPPITLLVLGLVGTWIIAGFRQPMR